VVTVAAVRVWESNWALYRRIWFSNAVGSLVQPFLYLLGMGVGVGSLIDRDSAADSMLGGASYLGFLAPGLIATTAMMTCATESMWPLMDGFRWTQSFHAITATPVRPADVMSGIGLWLATRVLIASGAVAVVLVIFDDTRSWGLLLAVAFAVLTGLSYAMPLAAWTSTRESEGSFPAILRFGVIPMFLFSGAFYPIDQLPAWLRPVAYVTPIYHGVELCRDAVLERLEPAKTAGHVAVLLILVVVAWVIARRTFTRRLYR
jgi:lipooligosaccharide transport system permease protein